MALPTLSLARIRRSVQFALVSVCNVYTLWHMQVKSLDLTQCQHVVFGFFQDLFSGMEQESAWSYGAG